VVRLNATTVDWQDVECGSYSADLPLWRELAEEARGPVLDLGCGTGRVALDLAARGHDVIALDIDPELTRELERRARERGLPLEVLTADARRFTLPREVGLALAPMQMVQLLGGPAGRSAMLAAVRAHLFAGGRFAAALADGVHVVPAPGELPPLPDVLERDGWVLSSQPVGVRAVDEGVAVDRLRQLVSPSGDFSEELASVRLDAVSAEQLEDEGRRVGLARAGRRIIPETADHVGSVVVVLEAAE
jgi:SAM-dependent methyltransferase